MYRDKKVLDGKLRLVLLRALGDAYVEVDSSESLLEKVLISACGS
jgi:3-dehydroquinate synthetase